MKRVIAILLTICLLLPTYCVGAVALTPERVVEELLEFTPEDRANMVAIAMPMLTTNAGLDMAQGLIKDFNPESNSMYNRLLKPIFKVVDQQTALNMLAQMYKIDEALRDKYFRGFKNRVAATLTPNSEAALNKMFADEIAQVKGMEQLCTEDGITAGVLAQFCGLFVELNQNAALLTDANENDFKLNTVSALLDDIMLGVTENKMNFTSSVTQLVQQLNQRYNALEKHQLKSALREIGLYAPSAIYAGSGLLGGGVAGNTTTEPKESGFGYKIIERSEADGDTIEVAYYENNVPVAGKQLEEPLKIAIPVNSIDVMLYHEEGNSVPVKYTAYADGMLYCRIDAVGTYKLYKVEPYFVDAKGWGKDYIEALFRRGIISGKSAGVFAPEAQITREEFVKLAVELFDLTDTSLTCEFSDVAANAWYTPYIASAKHHGIVNGISEERFGVGAPITRQDMCKILYGMLVKMELTGKTGEDALTFHDAASIAPYATEAVSALVELGIINGDDKGNFNPTANATRQEAAKLIYGMLALYVR